MKIKSGDYNPAHRQPSQKPHVPAKLAVVSQATQNFWTKEQAEAARSAAEQRQGPRVN